MKSYHSSKCFRCEKDAVINSGHYSYCGYHYRFMRMRTEADQKGKTVPSKDEMAELLAKHSDMICPVCKIKMHWLGRDGKKGLITLQHNMDGTFGILCFSCNVAHQFIPCDEFYDRQFGYRFCQDCQKYLPTTEFFKDTRLSIGLKSYCKKCANARTYKWRREVQYEGKADWDRF